MSNNKDIKQASTTTNTTSIGTVTGIVHTGSGDVFVTSGATGIRNDQETSSADFRQAEARQRYGTIDVGILTIREDEFKAALRRFPKDETVLGARYYNLHSMKTRTGQAKVAVLRSIEQGNGAAQDAVRDLISDLAPRWIIVAGIAGGIPTDDFSLGDVVVSTRVHDFSVEAVVKHAGPEYALGGGPLSKRATTLVANFPALVEELGDWASQARIGRPRPAVDYTSTANYYGDEYWQERVKRSLKRHFGPEASRQHPVVVGGSVASSDRLIKDDETLLLWLKIARQVLAVEMELAGVYTAVRRPEGEIPMIAIRGISDIVGFKRQPEWTEYACESAASFAYALISSGALS